jgi:hypothetical protein
MKCHVCGKKTDWKCESCEEPVCEDCCVPFTQFNQCTNAICECCGDTNNEIRASNQALIDEENEKIEKGRLLRNKKARIRYHSSEQQEKRRIKKEELRLESIVFQKERAEKLGKIMSNIFRGM